MKYACILLLLFLAACGPPPNDRKVPTYVPPIGPPTALATIEGSDAKGTVWVITVDGYRVAKRQLRNDGRSIPVDREDWDAAVVIAPGKRKIYSGFQRGAATNGFYSEAVVPFTAEAGHSYRLLFKADHLYALTGPGTCDFWVVDSQSNAVVSETVKSKIHPWMVKPYVLGGK
jgi:hypothetical protein